MDLRESGRTKDGKRILSGLGSILLPLVGLAQELILQNSWAVLTLTMENLLNHAVSGSFLFPSSFALVFGESEATELSVSVC